MQFSLIIVQGTPKGTPERFDEAVRQCVLAEELGYDRVWLTEHHFTPYGRPASQLLAAHVAAKTEQIRIGLAVIVLPFHHPLLIAEDIAVLDHLSNGRVDFGVGRGNQPAEFERFGIDMNDAYGRFTESLDIITGVWADESYAHDGEIWQFPAVDIAPKPLQQPTPPLWMVGVSERSIRMAGERRMNGMIGAYLTPLDVTRPSIELWHATLEELGVPAGELKVAHNEFVYVAESDEIAKSEAEQGAMWYSEMAGELWSSDDESLPENYATWRGLAEMAAAMEWDDLFENHALMGSPETVAGKVEQLEAMGVDEVILFMGFGPLPHEKSVKSMKLFAEEVMPAFKSSAEPVGAAS